MKHISRTIWILSLVSLFTDMASEMLYPVMPVYLESIGFSVLLIGVLEGLAETTAGLSKGYFGNWSDRAGKRLPFVQIGYGLSAASKPLLALFVFPLWVFFARTLDRLGKGIRTGARDALLSAETTPETKGQVFGFHRALDTLGAVLGPCLALLYLYRYPENYRSLFLLAFIPGMLAIGSTMLIRERKPAARQTKTRPGIFDFVKYWKTSSPAYRQLVGALLLFALFNSSDIFLLLQAKAIGLSDSTVIGVYIFYNLVFAVAALPMGILADKAGMRRVFTGGLLLFALVYLGMAFARTPIAVYGLFFLYGLYAAATEGVGKAWITNICKKEDTATAIGTYTGFQSICAFMASSLTGLVWYVWGAPVAFLLSAAVAIGVGGYLLISKNLH
ncbi:MAG: MFS transporter [Lewinellaceae bacterium]|nr:MFS transporter [Saprospiraceae bacterium]MCB9331636.1 MFS transporter [Lewinellaceae bacterium]